MNADLNLYDLKRKREYRSLDDAVGGITLAYEETRDVSFLENMSYLIRINYVMHFL